MPQAAGGGQEAGIQPPPRLGEREEAVGQHKEQVTPDHDSESAVDSQFHRQHLHPEEERRLREDQWQVEQPQRTWCHPHLPPLLVFQTPHHQNQRNEGAASGDEQGCAHSVCQGRAMPEPVTQCPGFGTRLGIGPASCQRPEQQSEQTGPGQSGQQPTRESSGSFQEGRRLAATACHPAPEAVEHQPFQQPRPGQCDQREIEQQHGPRRCKKAKLKVRFVDPLQDQHGQRRRGRRAEDQANVHHREREGQHCKHRQSQQGVKLGQHQPPPRRHRGVAQRLPCPDHHRGPHLRQCRERHQQQIRGFLENQAEDQRQPP